MLLTYEHLGWFGIGFGKNHTNLDSFTVEYVNADSEVEIIDGYSTSDGMPTTDSS
jgi:hypothetical protein